MTEEFVLAGDIGGTKSNLAFYQGSPAAPVMVTEQTYRSSEFASFTEVAREFFASSGPCRQERLLRRSRCCSGGRKPSAQSGLGVVGTGARA